MRVIVTFLVVLFAGIQVSFAQCTPDPLYADSAFGIWPNPSEGLPDATVGQPYSLVLNLKVPLSGGDIDPNFSLVTIQSASISSISDAPDGLDYVCDDGLDCDWLGGEQGCVHVSGVPTTPGTYTMSVNMQVIPQGIPAPIPYSFEDLVLVVNDTSTAVAEFATPTLAWEKVSASGGTLSVRYNASHHGNATIRVLDLLGKPVSTTKVSGKAGRNAASVNVSTLSGGVYFVSLEQNNQRVTKRLVISQR